MVKLLGANLDSEQELAAGFWGISSDPWRPLNSEMWGITKDDRLLDEDSIGVILGNCSGG